MNLPIPSFYLSFYPIQFLRKPVHHTPCYRDLSPFLYQVSEIQVSCPHHFKFEGRSLMLFRARKFQLQRGMIRHYFWKHLQFHVIIHSGPLIVYKHPTQSHLDVLVPEPTICPSVFSSSKGTFINPPPCMKFPRSSMLLDHPSCPPLFLPGDRAVLKSPTTSQGPLQSLCSSNILSHRTLLPSTWVGA